MGLSLEEKLKLWVKITGVDPSCERKSYSIYLNGRLSDYDIEKMNDRIKESLEFDETGIFAEAYLSIYLKKFLDNKNVSLSELLGNKELCNYVEDVRKLYDSIKETDAETLIVNEAKRAMEFYNLPCNLDALAIMELRSSAVNCMNGKLNLLQFSAGSKKADSFKLSREIYMFENLDALILCSARGNLNGVTLGYIRNEKDLTDSYFAFIIKNGDNLYILTDMPKYKHPAQKKMSRCPGRNMSNRIEANWFPYDSVANIDISDLWNSGRYGVREKRDDLSVTQNVESPYAVIGFIDSLKEDESFWFIMMAALIKKKFYEEEKLPLLPISYTRSMINTSLLQKTENAMIVQKSLPNMDLKEIKIEDTYDLEYERDFEDDSEQFRYLIDRYKDQVDNTLLNVIDNTDKAFAIEDKYAKKNYFGEKLGCEYLFLDLEKEAGTKEEIEYRQKWIARYNYAKSIRKIVEEDYKKKEDDIYKIIKDYITPRIDILVKMHLKNELIGNKVERKGFGSYYTNERESISKMYEFNHFYDSDESFGKFRYGFTGYHKAGCKCAFTGKAAGVAITIKPRNAQELALVCGISINELPIELRHYDRKQDKYYGNSILENIDPFLWVIDDPYNTMEFGITILLSKRKYLEFCNQAEVDAVKFWENEKPVCHQSKKEQSCNGKIYRKWNHDHYESVLAKKCEKCKWYVQNVKKNEDMEE